jgi:uncharacterized protein (TIGR02271 family)
MKQTVIGIFNDASEAKNAVEQLLENGFLRANVDISFQKSDQDQGGIRTFFSSLFETDEANSYADVAGRSGAIVTVHAESEDEAWRAGEILDQSGAVDMSERGGQSAYAASGTADYASSGTPVAEPAHTEATIPIIEEQLNVGKKEVETGRTRLRSRIIERPVEESLRLREEHVHVERNTVDRPATEADLSSFKEGEIELTEHAEVPVVAKEARVVEEVRVGKDVEEREETITGTVRKTEVDVEETAGDHSRK